MQDPILGELLSDTRAVVARLLEEPPRSRESLTEALATAAARNRAAVRRSMSVADGGLAERLTDRCEALLGLWDGLDLRGRKLVQAAVLYFALEDDGAADLDSAFGFDDDAEVIDVVGRALGLPPLEVR
jgi:hypothetical protein